MKLYLNKKLKQNCEIQEEMGNFKFEPMCSENNCFDFTENMHINFI